MKFVAINGDEYRQYHPRATELNEEYGQDAPKYTQPFSNTLVEYLKAECLRLRCNFIIEGTMRTYAVIERTAQEIKQAGFRCEAHALAIHRQDSLLGVFQRFESDKQRTGVGRFSPIAVHDEAYRQIPLNLAKAEDEKLFDRIVVYTRQPDGQLTMGLERTGDQLEPANFNREFDRLRQPIFDQIFYHQQWLALLELAQTRNETNDDYLKQIDAFVQLFSV
ncbi:zeta toxin family protein [Spirosoma sp. KCTC 42546]|uniref:zeta toxin family protein n=1 Tax=Spirosoma sp. KCTC 42546 TaxID=2520506 RepID=UPI001FEDB946|nr:zeta toxin family protein [Spirosoma sp. KCTC 42546]